MTVPPPGPPPRFGAFPGPHSASPSPTSPPSFPSGPGSQHFGAQNAAFGPSASAHTPAFSHSATGGQSPKSQRSYFDAAIAGLIAAMLALAIAFGGAAWWAFGERDTSATTEEEPYQPAGTSLTSSWSLDSDFNQEDTTAMVQGVSFPHSYVAETGDSATATLEFRDGDFELLTMILGFTDSRSNLEVDHAHVLINDGTGSLQDLRVDVGEPTELQLPLSGLTMVVITASFFDAADQPASGSSFVIGSPSVQ